jgi:Zn-dependent protease with chaperone function
MKIFIIQRAVLAVVLMIGFYALALGISFGLLLVPYAEYTLTNDVTPQVAVICVLSALIVLWSVLPRADSFSPPGPRLRPGQYPRLFQRLEMIARATRQAMPAEVYLVPEVNAWVMLRGGIMGFGSHRVMGLGLPLMRFLTCSQLSAVLAHEFGHYHGGDTRISPWIYKTRAAIERTVRALEDRAWLQLPFRLYADMFLDITHAVSRRQEFIADELAARTVGAKPLIEGLHAIHKIGPAFAYYWQSECASVLKAGYLPPLLDGFDQFLRAGPVIQLLEKRMAEELSGGQTDPYDTHPSLKDRIAALASLSQGSDAMEDPPAVSLLENVPALEGELTARMAGREGVAGLTPIAWSEVGPRVYVPQARRLAHLNAAALNGVTPGSLGELVPNLKALGKRLVDFRKQHPDDDHAERMASAVAGAALALLLIQRGGQLDTTLGQPISVRIGGHDLQPMDLLMALKDGRITIQGWQRQCAELGIAEADLAAVALAEGPEEAH